MAIGLSPTSWLLLGQALGVAQLAGAVILLTGAGAGAAGCPAGER